MIELSQQQRQALGEPEPLVIDPQTKETYVLLLAVCLAERRDRLPDFSG
jgi:hypothetical protein